MASDLEAAAIRFRRELLLRERSAATELIRTYGVLWESLRLRLNLLTGDITAARAAGRAVSPAWLFRQARYQELADAVEREVLLWIRIAESTVTAAQGAAAGMASRHALTLIDLALQGGPPLFLKPISPVENLVGFLADGSPLRQLLASFGPQAGAAVRAALVEGVVLGRGVREIARSVRDAASLPLSRALTISRTETLRAYRETSRQVYQANGDVVAGWIWYASLSPRTCAACLALHGSFHRAEERLDGHPRCRCVAVPVTKTWAELGFENIPESRPEIEPGAAWFARQSAEVQRAVLGISGQEAYSAGRVGLEDFVGRKHSPRWGSMRYAKSVREALAAA